MASRKTVTGHTTRSAEILVDAFVALVNQGPRDPKTADEVSLRVALPSADASDLRRWRIVRMDAPWIETLESKLPARFPLSYRCLVTRYAFPAFEVGPLWLFANTPEGAPFSSHELRIGIFQDKILSRRLLGNGYIQFARPAGGSYDPICFDVSRRARDGEYRVVRLDHEEILCHERITILEEPARSFRSFLETMILVSMYGPRT